MLLLCRPTYFSNLLVEIVKVIFKRFESHCFNLLIVNLQMVTMNKESYDVKSQNRHW